MVTKVEPCYPSIYAEEKFLPKLKSARQQSFEGLNEDLLNCFTRITSPSFPDNYMQDLTRLISSPLNSEIKQLLKNYSSLMYLTTLIESQSSSSDEIFQVIESIEDPDFSKDFYYDFYIFRFTQELEKKTSLESLKSLLPSLARVPKHKYEAICDTLFIKINAYIDISSQDLTYLAETLKLISELAEIHGLSILESNLFENIQSKIKFHELLSGLPEEFKSQVSLPTTEEIRTVLGLLKTSNLKPEQKEILNGFHSLYNPIIIEESKQPADTKSLTHGDSDQSTLTTSKKSMEFEYHLDGIAEYISKLPIKSWDQIKRIDRIMKNEPKGLEVIRAVIRDVTGAEIRDETGNEIIVAVKTNICDKKLESITMQAEYMALVHDHKNFLKLFGAFWDKCEGKERFTLVMELGYETLTERICRWDSKGCAKEVRESEALKAAKQLIEAMTILNQKDICHRDIKPDNIFITKEDIYKIADFDVSKKIERNLYGVTEIDIKQSISGTQNYMSPELRAFANGMDTIKGIDYNKSDVYSLGLTVLTMLTKKDFTTWNGLSGSLQGSMYRLIDECVENNELKLILKDLLVVDPEARPKFREALQNTQRCEATIRDEFE